MQKFILYCDLSTMNCTADDICKELEKFTLGYVQTNNSLWFFKYDNESDFNPFSNDEHLFYDHFEKFTNEESIIFLEILRRDHYYNLPDDVHNFLEQD